MELFCPRCEHQEPLQKKLTYLCPSCQSNQEVRYDYASIAKNWSKQQLASSKDQTLWRYNPLYPTQQTISSPPLGMTPCFQSPRLAGDLGLEQVWIKDDSVTPSSSFKDRASAIALLWAKEAGYKTITAASTGNAGAATALWGTLMDLPTNIFLPSSAPPAKVAQLLAFGAKVIMVEGSYDDAFELCLEASQKFGWYNRNTGYNPLTREGKKSVSFEISEQMNWQPPEVVVVSVGDGNIISGVWKGFVELKKIGWIEKCPRLLAVQAEGSSAIVQAWEKGTEVKAVQANTIADSISVDLPRDGDAALRAIKESNGWGITVSDQEILSAIPQLAQRSGVFAEPAAVTSFAGLQKAQKQGLLGKTQQALMLITGHGLKDISAVQKAVGKPYVIKPKLSALEEILSSD